MQNIRIITDSASDILPGTLPGVTVIPLTVTFGNTAYQDGVTIGHREFYEKLIESDTLPTTSLASPEVFRNAYLTALNNSEEVIVITLSGALSGNYTSAVLGAEGLEEHVRIVDSRNAALGQRILIEYAVKLVGEGFGPDEIVCELESAKKRIRLVALLDTLEYLKKGGRISPTVAFVAGALSIKPVVAVKDGEVAMLGKARGSRNGANFLIKEVETAGVDFSMPLCLGYTGLSDAMLRKYIEDSRFLWENYDGELPIASVGAAIGTHIGPGAIAVTWFAKK